MPGLLHFRLFTLLPSVFYLFLFSFRALLPKRVEKKDVRGTAPTFFCFNAESGQI